MRYGRRTPPQPPRSSRDRWLVAYADMLTLLFAVFVSLYAARVDFLPQAAIAASGDGVLPGSKKLWDQISDVITHTSSLKAFEMRKEERGTVISMPEAGAFAAGRAQLSPEAQRAIKDLAAVLLANQGQIRVEGHTDDVPIHNANFASNWELSTARATEVVEFLVDQCGLPATRLSAAGFGEFKPRTPNTSTASRASNRRVDLIILGSASELNAKQ